MHCESIDIKLSSLNYFQVIFIISQLVSSRFPPHFKVQFLSH